MCGPVKKYKDALYPALLSSFRRIRFSFTHGSASPHRSYPFDAMMKDTSDGTMDGMMGGTPISMNGMGGGSMMMGNMQSTAGTSGLATAMTTFIMNTSVNMFGLTTTDMQTLITKLNGSSGIIQ